MCNYALSVLLWSILALLFGYSPSKYISSLGCSALEYSALECSALGNYVLECCFSRSPINSSAVTGDV